MNIKTPLSPPRSNKILNQIQQHSQLIAHLSKEHKPPADFSFRNDTFNKISSSPYKVEVKKSEVTKNILMNFPTYPKNSSKCTSSMQMNSSDYVGHSNPLFHENDKSDGTLAPTKEIAVTSNSEKVFAELVQLESVLLSSVTSNAITNKSETGSSNESQRNCSRSATPDKSLSCISTTSTNTDSVNNENDSKSMTLHNMTSDGIKETKHISHRSTCTDVTKKTKCAEIDASCNSKISHVSSAAATTADVLYWRNKCFELENILKGYQEKAAMVRRLFNQKMQQNETKLQEILSRAQQAEHELSRVSKECAAERVENTQESDGTDLKPACGKDCSRDGDYGKDCNRDDINDDCDNNNIQEKIAIINNLKLQIQAYKNQRKKDIERVESNSKKIRNWVAMKFQQLELKNSQLEEEKLLLEKELNLLKEKMKKVERPPKQASANFQQAQSTPPRTAPGHCNKDQLHFLSSNFFHNKSPDTDDGNDDDNQDDDNDDDVGDENYNDINNYSNDNKNNLFESPQLQYINDDNQKDFPTVLSSSSLPIMMSGHDMMNSSSSSSTAFAPAPLLPTNKMPPMPPVKIERKVFPTDLSLSFVSSCDDDRLLNDSFVQSVNHDDEDVGAGDGNDGLMNENIGNSQQTLKDYVNSSKQISDSCNSQASSKKRKNIQNFVCHDSCNKRNVNTSSSAKVKSSAINSCHNNNPSSLTLNKTNNNAASALKTGKPSTIDKNFKPSSYANKKSFNNSTKAGTSSFHGNGNNSKPPTPPLRRMPSWESRIREAAVDAFQKMPSYSSSSSSSASHHTCGHSARVVSYFKRASCVEEEMALYALHSGLLVKLSNAHFKSSSVSHPSEMNDDSRTTVHLDVIQHFCKEPTTVGTLSSKNFMHKQQQQQQQQRHYHHHPRHQHHHQHQQCVPLTHSTASMCDEDLASNQRQQPHYVMSSSSPFRPTTSRSPQKLLKKNKKFHKEKRCLLECNDAYINTEHKSADVNDGPLSDVAAADKQPDVCQESSNSSALHDRHLQQQQQQLQPSINYDESADTTYCNQLTQSDTSSDYALPPDDDDDVVDGVDGLGDYHNRDDNDDETGMRDGSRGCGKDGSKRDCKRSSCNKIISGSMGIGYNDDDDDVIDDEEKEMNTYDDGVESHMVSPIKFSVRNSHGDSKNDDIYNNNYDCDDNDDDSSLQPTKCGYMFLIASHYPTTDNNNNNDGNDVDDEVSRILWRRCWCVCGGVQHVAADTAASTSAAANNDDDVASFFYIFKSKHAATPLKRVNMRSCLCVTREENVVIVSLARNNQDEPSTGDHHILKLACTSNQLATEWCLALNKKRCEFELTEKHLDQVASWVTLTTIDGTSTCWSVLKDNSMVLFEQPLSEAPLGKIQLSHYHVEESSMVIYPHHPLHHHRKSNEFSSGRKTGDDVDGDVGSDNNDDSLMIILWPSLPASTLQKSSSGLSPVYLNIHKSSNDVQWYHSLLKTAALRRNSSSNITSSVSNIQLTPSKFSATSVRQHSDFEKLVHNLLLSTDGHLSSFASAASTSASSSSPATATRSTTTTTAHALWKDPLLLPSKQSLTHSILTMHNPELEKVARDIFDTILKFMLLPLDSIDMDKKVGLVQSIFELCIRNHHCLKDELYCQLIKQTAHVVSHIQSQQQHHKTLGTLLCGGHHWFLCDSSPTSPLNSTIESSDLKLTSPNSQSESSIQAWQLLAMAIPLFLPARCSIRWLLRTYLQRSSDSKSESGKFASFCERAVERTMKNGPRCHPPSHLEVISVLSHNPYHHSQPISIPIHLSNNSYQVVSFDGSTTILELLRTLNEQLNMRSHTQSGYALFACNSNAQEQLICCHDYKTKICDVLSFLEAKFNMNNKSKHDRNPVKLIYKNRLYMRHNLQHETSKEMLLCCYQLNEQICSAFMPISWSLAVELAALMAQIEFGDIKISSDVKPAKTSSTSSSSSSSSHLIILAQVIERFFPQHLLSEYSADVKKNRDSMESRLVDSWFKLRGKASSDCVRVYLAVLRRWEFTGAAMMHVKSIRSEGGGVEDVIFGVHCDGVCVLHCKTLSPLLRLEYSNIQTFGSCDNCFVIISRSSSPSSFHVTSSSSSYKRHSFIVSKSQAQEITNLMADYIKMNSSLKTR